MNHRNSTVLFVHGWWGGPWVWDLFAQPFEEAGFHCETVDLNWNVETRKNDLASFTTHLERLKSAVDAAENPIVIGHSAGGLLIQKLIESTDVRAIVLLASAAPRWIFPIRSLRLARFAIRHAINMLVGQPFLPPKRDMIAINLNALTPAEQSFVYGRMIPVSGQQCREVALTGVPIRKPVDHPPTFVVSGSLDRLTPPAIGLAIAKKLRADFREYPKNAHYLMREPNHRQIAGDVIEWLASHRIVFGEVEVNSPAVVTLPI